MRIFRPRLTRRLSIFLVLFEAKSTLIWKVQRTSARTIRPTLTTDSTSFSIRWCQPREPQCQAPAQPRLTRARPCQWRGQSRPGRSYRSFPQYTPARPRGRYRLYDCMIDLYEDEAQHLFIQYSVYFWLINDIINIIYKNHDLAIARSSSSRADPVLRVAFKYLNASSQCSVALIYIFKYPHTGQWHWFKYLNTPSKGSRHTEYAFVTETQISHLLPNRGNNGHSLL